MKRIAIVLTLIMCLIAAVAYAQIPYGAWTTGNSGPGGDWFKAASSVSTSASGTYAIPLGTYIVYVDSTGTLQVNIGTAASANWQKVAASSVGVFLFSDGAMYRILAGATTAITTLIQMR